MVTLCFDVDTILHCPTHCTMRNNERYKIGIILEMSIEMYLQMVVKCWSCIVRVN